MHWHKRTCQIRSQTLHLLRTWKVRCAFKSLTCSAFVLKSFCSWKESTVVVCGSEVEQVGVNRSSHNLLPHLCNSTCALSSCRGDSLVFYALDWVSHRVIDSIAHIVRWDAVITAFVSRLLPFSHHCYFLNCSPVVRLDRLLVAAVLLPSFWLHLICDGGKWQPSGYALLRISYLLEPPYFLGT